MESFQRRASYRVLQILYRVPGVREQTKPQELISIDPAALPSPQDPLLNIKLKDVEKARDA